MNIFHVNFEQIVSSGDSGVIICRLAMGLNDLQASNVLLEIANHKKFSSSEEVNRGLALYSMRLQCSHLNEIIPIIKQIKSSDSLYNKIHRCSKKARTSFEELTKICDDRDLNRILIRIRSELTFHYNSNKKNNECKTIKTGLENRVKKGNKFSKINYGIDLNSSRMTFADDLLDTIVCRNILGIEEKGDLKDQVYENLRPLEKACLNVLRFGQEFILEIFRDINALS